MKPHKETEVGCNGELNAKIRNLETTERFKLKEKYDYCD